MSLPMISPELGIRLASALIHAEEALGPNGHPHDVQVFRTLLFDPDVREYLEELDALALLPLKRR